MDDTFPTFNINNPEHWNPPPYTREHPPIDFPALWKLSQAARALRVVEIVAERHPELDPNSVAFGAKVLALDLAIDLKRPIKSTRRTHA